MAPSVPRDLQVYQVHLVRRDLKENPERLVREETQAQSDPRDFLAPRLR